MHSRDDHMLRILALEPYYGGSHKAFLDGYRAHSRHSVELLTMPARKWKWRMRGAALSMGHALAEWEDAFDVLFVSDFVDLAALVGTQARRLRGIPRVAYFHENQLTYPVPSEDERDYQFGFTNITTCLASDCVLFNSHYHLDSFVDAAERLLRRMPDFVPDWTRDAVHARSSVVPVGVDLASIDAARSVHQPEPDAPLTVLWNHRWEYDKAAEEFFDVMTRLDAAGQAFRLCVTGESFREVPAVFEAARARLADHVKTFGYLESRADYVRALVESDVVVSTAVQEFFGISVVEAIRAGCAPLLPNRLSYPEILPEPWHGRCLYEGREGLEQRLARWLSRPEEARSVDLGGAMSRFAWGRVAPALDDVMERACEEGRHA